MQGLCYVEFILPEEAGSFCTPYVPLQLDRVEAACTDFGAVIRGAVRGGGFLIIELDRQIAKQLAAGLAGSRPPADAPL